MRVLAGNLLFPRLPRGLPTFVPSFTAPADIVKLPPAKQLAALRARAERGGVRELLLYGVGLQRVGRPVSARAAFARAARMRPARSRRRTSLRPSDASTRLVPQTPSVASGPLTRRFPNDPTVRFHLGVLLLWTARIEEAERQFRLAAATQPGSPLAQEAERYLETIHRARAAGG